MHEARNNVALLGDALHEVVIDYRVLDLILSPLHDVPLLVREVPELGDVSDKDQCMRHVHLHRLRLLVDILRPHAVEDVDESDLR